MTIYKHTEDMGEISGFGGEYEALCQEMLHAGVTWLVADPKRQPKYVGIEGVFGLAKPSNPAAEELDEVLRGVPGADEATGAMHHAVIERVMYIGHFGWKKYCAETRKKK